MAKGDIKELTIDEQLEKLEKTSPEWAAQIYALWKQRQDLSFEQLKAATADGVRADDYSNLLGNKPISVKDAEDAEQREFAMTTDAMNATGFLDNMFADVPEKARKAIITEGAKGYFLDRDYKDLLDRAIAAGYVDPIPGNATEEEKQNQRTQMGQVYKELGRLATSQTRQKIAYGKDPEQGTFGDLQDFINGLFFKNLNRRMRDKAARGEDINAGDYVTLGGDFLTNVLLGTSGLNGVGTFTGTGLAALAGLNDARTRDFGTDDDLDAGDYLTDSGLNALSAFIVPSGIGIIKQKVLDPVTRIAGRLPGAWRRTSQFIRDIGLASSGEAVDVAKKYGKKGVIGKAVFDEINPIATDAGIQAYTKSKVGPMEKDDEAEYAKLEKRKPTATRLYKMHISDWNLPPEQRLTADELDLINRVIKKRFEKMLGGEQ